MDVQDNFEPVAPSSLPEVPSRRAMKTVLLALLVLGLSALAVLAVRAINKEPIEAVSEAAGHKVSAGLDQPAQAAAQSARAAEPAPITPATTLVEERAASATPNIAEGPKIVGSAGRAPAEALFGVGDRLKVAFFERVEVEEDKWGRASSASALRGILQRPELSGEYTVQGDGTISVPLLGSIPVANRSVQQVHANLAESFEQLLGRKGLVNILSLERSPIYVLGPVKNPGSFKYVPGMTILHAIALAGGLDRGASDPWQKIEAVREIQKRSGAVDAMLKLLARGAVLKAERDGMEPKIPPRLIGLVGAAEAANLVNEQSDRRKAVAIARKNRERATLTGLESAKQDVAVYGRMEALDELVKLRQDRVNSMRTLVDRNVLSMPVLNQVQSELTDAEQRRRDALNQYAMAKQRLASMEAEAQRVQADLKNDLEAEIETIERQIADNEREFSISEGVLDTLPATRAPSAKENRVTYQVVRQTAAGPVGIESAGMTVLQPGDLVNIIVGESEPKEQKGAPAPASPVGEKSPASEASRAKEAAERTADEFRQALQQEHEKAEKLASELAKAQRENETQTATADTAAGEATRAKQAAERTADELRQALQQEHEKAEKLASELAKAQRENETQTATVGTAAGEATRAKQAAERTADELRQALQQEHEKAEKLASELAKARSELETQAATKADDDAAQKTQLAELRQALQKAEAFRDEILRRGGSSTAGSSDTSGQMPAPAADKPVTASLPTPDGQLIPAGPASDMLAMASTAPSKQPATRTTRPETAQTTANPEADRLVVRASLLFEQGNIGAARNMLDRAVELGSAHALFVLAETYDPRVLSARQTFGIQSDSAKARELYAKALAGGIRDAQKRLDALPP
jgi:protein involved in polysaccharide export with SLBB domain/septal ring factor EnvC (AmiA/AmiB activator)